MTPEQQRLKIAEIHGVKVYCKNECYYFEVPFHNPSVLGHYDKKPKLSDLINYLPDYLNSLDAMHEVIMCLSFDNQRNFGQELHFVLIEAMRKNGFEAPLPQGRAASSNKQKTVRRFLLDSAVGVFSPQTSINICIVRERDSLKIT